MNFEQIPKAESDTNKKNEFPFSYEFPDGTMGRYKTKEELLEAIEESNENRD